MNTSLISSCSFFGHRETKLNEPTKKLLIEYIEALILNNNCHTFYFGGLGEFDWECYKIVSWLKQKYPFINRIYCLHDKRFGRVNKRPAWMQEYQCEEYIYLDIDYEYWYTRIYYRNCEMIKLSNFVIFYVDTSLDGGANKTLKFAKKLKKPYVNFFITK